MTPRSIFAAIAGWFGPAALPDSQHTTEVLNRNAERLMRLRGVMSVGLGQTDDGRPAILLGLGNPLAIPENLPEDVEGVPVVHTDVSRPEVLDQ
jgi:hypothetical protein